MAVSVACLGAALSACDAPETTGPLEGPDLFRIEGSVWLDRGADGTRDPGDRGLDGFRVFLDENGNGVLDGDERSTTTDVDGAFSFVNLRPDRAYTVTQSLPVAWTNTAPGGPAVVSARQGRVDPAGSADAPDEQSADPGRPFRRFSAGPNRPALAAPTAGPARVVGGQDAQLGEFPGTVAVLHALFSPPFEALFCGGTLVAGRWVLTAASCVVESGAVSVPDVLVGALDVEVGGRRLRPQRAIVHPDYDEVTSSFNVALLELRDVELESRALVFESVPASLVEPGSPATATGWGAVTPDGEFFFTTLQKADLDVLPNTLCNDVYGGITADMLCAGGEPGVGVCYYDDGSGLFVRVQGVPHQVGVGSWSGVDENGLCASEGLPSGWSRVSAIQNFLRTHVLPERSGAVTVAGRPGGTASVEFGNFR